jgi:hypothetical protein
VLAGKSKAQIHAATRSALETKAVPALEPGAMCFMMAKQQYLSDAGMNWHPHVMFFVSGDAAKGWGADLPGSPIIATNDPEERVTIFMVLAGTWYRRDAWTTHDTLIDNSNATTFGSRRRYTHSARDLNNALFVATWASRG